MPRRGRRDQPGAWHHVMDRAIARRTLFENRRDIRFFLSCLAREVRNGALEIHAFCVMTTHFHLLVRSLRGELPRVMQRVLDAYARRFNRARERDGPLFRGRYTNRVVESDSYWLAVVRYIDRNPVKAGLVQRPVDYPYGSAIHYSRQGGPPWLRRDLVEAMSLEEAAEGAVYDPLRYGDWTSETGSEGAAWIVESKLRGTGRDMEDPLVDLVGAAPSKVRAWMESKALLADGTKAGWVLLSPATVQSALKGPGEACPVVQTQDTGVRDIRREGMVAGMLRAFSGLSQEEIAIRMGLPRGTIRERLKAHRDSMRSDQAYRDGIAGILAACVRRDHGDAPGKRIPFVRPLEAPDGERRTSASPGERG